MILLSRFDRKKEEAIYRYNKSSDLKASAWVIRLAANEALSSEINVKLWLGGSFSFDVACKDTYFMLCGLSLELIFKAILVQNEHFRYKKNHDLKKLALSINKISWINLNYTKQEEKILGYLSGCIYWQGKYPTSLKPEYYEKQKEIEIDIFCVKKWERTRCRNIFDWDFFVNMYNKASDCFKLNKKL